MGFEFQVALGELRVAKSDLRLWDVATGKLVFALLNGDSPIQNAVTFLPDGKTIASAHGFKDVRLWDVKTGKSTHLLQCKFDIWGSSDVTFAPDGGKLAGIEAGTNLWIWDLKTGKCLKREVKTDDYLRALAFSSDGAVLATATSGGIRLYKASNLEEIRRFDALKQEKVSLAFTSDGKTLVSMGEDQMGEDRILRLWDVNSGKQRRELPQLEGGSNLNGEGSLFAVSPDGKTVATGDRGWSGVIQLWDAQTGKALVPRVPHLGSVHHVAVLQDGETVFSQVDSSDAVVWPHGTGKESRSVKLPLEALNCRLGQDRSTLAVSTAKGELVLLDIASERELVRFLISKWMEVKSLSADNNRLVVAVEPDDFAFWDVATKKEIYRLGRDGFSFKGSSLDGRRIAGANFNDFRVWDVGTKRKLFQDETKYPSLGCLAFSPDGRMVAIATDTTIRLLETATCKVRLHLPMQSGGISALAFSPDGRMLASGGYNRFVRLWDVRDGKELEVYHGHLSQVTALDFAPDGRRLVSGSVDTTVLIWEIPAAIRNRKLGVAKLGQQEQNQLWEKMADKTDTTMAYAAMQRLSEAPVEAVTLCRARVVEVPKITAEQIQRWIVELDDEAYPVRETASANLARIYGEAEQALEKTLKGTCSAEVRRRIEPLLEKIKNQQVPLHVQRAIELLEQIGTAEAVDVLRQLEKKTGDIAVRDDVRRSLGRLAAKQKAP